MSTDLLSRLSALLAQEKHIADRTLNEAIWALSADLSSKGNYHGSSNVHLSKGIYEGDIEGRVSKLLAITDSLLRSASPREIRDCRQAIEDTAVGWIESHIADSQTRLNELATKLAQSTPQHIDLGSTRIIEALRAQLALLRGGRADTFSPTSETFVDPVRLDELESIPPVRFDVSRLVRLCQELNIAFGYHSFHLVAFGTRAILDQPSSRIRFQLVWRSRKQLFRWSIFQGSCSPTRDCFKEGQRSPSPQSNTKARSSSHSRAG